MVVASAAAVAVWRVEHRSGHHRGMSPAPEIRRAAEVLRDGGLVAFPTETVYGLGADASNPIAVGRIFTVKGRPSGHPLIVHLATAAALDEWACDIPDAARLLAAACWPGPLTMILSRSPQVPDVVTGGRPTVGLRVPDHPVAQALLTEFGGGVAAPSANRFGQVSPTTAAHVRADLGDAVELILDGEPALVGVESTIIDLSGAEPEILRPGGVPVDRLTELLGVAPRLWGGDGPARAPGMLTAHYSPKARVVLVDAAGVAARAGVEVDAGHAVGVLAPTVTDALPPEVIELEPAGGPASYARVVYDRLRQADRLSLEVLLVVPPRAEGVGIAVLDRLRRAAAG